MKLRDRVAVVTGAGSGIGKAIARSFADAGARVVVNDIDGDAARAVASELPNDALAIVADVSDSAAVTAMFEEVDKTCGDLHVLVNNAGIAELKGTDYKGLEEKGQARMAEVMSGGPIKTHFDVLLNMTDEDWHRMIAVHLHGTFYCCREALKIMIRRDDGSAIINMSSIAGLGGISVAPHYGAAKAGLLGLTKSLADELGSRGIRVNAICPGFIETPMTEFVGPMMRTMIRGRTPLGRMGTPDEIASAALFLATSDSSFITGQWLSPNGGFFIA